MKLNSNSFLISIIIPTYNSGKYLNECLKSIVNQSYKNIEIVIIDDGSTDNSVDIINNYCLNDNRICVYTANNSGVSSARNIGLQKAKGEYILFVDSDDYLKDDSVIETLANNINNYDVIRFNTGILFNNKVIENKKIVYSKNDYHSGNEFIDDVLSNEVDYGWYLWQYLYKKELWDKVAFPKGRIFEDTYTIYRTLLNAHNIKTLEDIIYIHRINNDSLTNNINYKTCEDMIYVISESSKYASSLSISNKTKELLLNNFSYSYISLVNALNIIDKSEKSKLKALLLNNKVVLNNCKLGKAKIVKYAITLLGIDIVAFLLKIRKKISK